jgi:hypothetical protein
MAERRLLLAGSFGAERVPVRLNRDEADWFKPPHIRDERSARERIATQVACGADVVVAPTWLTHRRALLPLAETRNVAAWTAAAVRVARDGVEIGLERRAEAAAITDADQARTERSRPRVAASLPALDDEPEPEVGQVLPREAATERDYRDQAGVLADAEPDLLLIEGQREEAETRLAMAEAVDTGLPVWAALGHQALATTALEEWIERCRALEVERLLLPRPLERWSAAAENTIAWGGYGLAPDEVRDWLDAGARIVACLDGATIASLQPLRAKIDDYESAEVAATRASERRWLDHVARAASMAPGGAAVWLGAAPNAPLPVGFEWLIVGASDAPHLPTDHYRLVVAPEPTAGAGGLLEYGGLLVRSGAARVHGEAMLQLVSVDDSADPPLAIYRREQ